MATSTTTLVACANLGLTLAVCGGEDAQGQSDSGRLVRLRIPDHDVQRAVEEGLRRSQTFRSSSTRWSTRAVWCISFACRICARKWMAVSRWSSAALGRIAICA